MYTIKMCRKRDVVECGRRKYATMRYNITTVTKTISFFPHSKSKTKDKMSLKTYFPVFQKRTI